MNNRRQTLLLIFVFLISCSMPDFMHASSRNMKELTNETALNLNLNGSSGVIEHETSASERKQVRIERKQIRKNSRLEKKAMKKKMKGETGKSQIVALILAIFLGGLGIHRFYLGYTGWGILYLLTAGLFGIGWFIDIILLIIPNGLTPKGTTRY